MKTEHIPLIALSVISTPHYLVFDYYQGFLFQVGFALVACAMGAPSGIVAPAGYLNAGAVGFGHAGALVSAPVAHAPAVVGQTHSSYAAGPAVVENRVEYGVVGNRVVQTGEVAVVAGHQYAVAGHEAIPQPATSYVAGAPQNLVETRPIAPPAIPAAPAPYAVNIPAGPAPADKATLSDFLQCLIFRGC